MKVELGFYDLYFMFTLVSKIKNQLEYKYLQVELPYTNTTSLVFGLEAYAIVLLDGQLS